MFRFNFPKSAMILCASLMSVLLTAVSAQAGLLNDMMDTRTVLLPMLGAAGIFVAGCFAVVSRSSRKQRAAMIAQYDDELNKFRRSIRGGSVR